MMHSAQFAAASLALMPTNMAFQMKNKDLQKQQQKNCAKEIVQMNKKQTKESKTKTNSNDLGPRMEIEQVQQVEKQQAQDKAFREWQAESHRYKFFGQKLLTTGQPFGCFCSNKYYNWVFWFEFVVCVIVVAVFVGKVVSPLICPESSELVVLPLGSCIEVDDHPKRIIWRTCVFVVANLVNLVLVWRTLMFIGEKWEEAFEAGRKQNSCLTTCYVGILLLVSVLLPFLDDLVGHLGWSFPSFL